METKKGLIILLIFGFLPLISAQSLEIVFPLGNEFEPGEEIVFSVNLYGDDSKILYV